MYLIYKSSILLGGENMTKERFDQIIIDHYRDGYRLALTILRHPSDSQDALHNAIEMALRKTYQLKSDEKAKSWFMTIVYREAIKISRKKKQTIAVESFEEGSTDQDIKDLINHDLLEGLLSMLSEKDQHIFWMKYAMEYTFAEIALIVGSRESSVKSRIYRGLKKMQEQAGEEVLENGY